jgi:hypothetical protein
MSEVKNISMVIKSKIKSKDNYMNRVKKLLPENTNYLSLTNNKTPTEAFANKDPKIHNILAKNSNNYGIRCKDLVCVDCDLDKHGQDIEDKYKNTFTQQTGGGGFHYVYIRDERMHHWKMRSNLGDKKYDIKIGENSYFVGAGSKSKKGSYTIYNEIKPSRMPDGLFNELNCFYVEKGNPDPPRKPIIKNTCPEPEIKKTMMEINQVINKCPMSYFSDYDRWRNIGWAMHYENNSEECKELFIKRSREVPEYKDIPDETYNHFWYNSNKLNSKQITFGTIIKWLKRDGLWDIKPTYDDKEFDINTFYSIKLPKKPEDDFIDKLSLKEKRNKKEKDIIKLFNLRKVYFNKFHFKVARPVCYCIIYEDSVDIKKKSEFKDLYDNLLIDDKSFTSLWFKDIEIKTYRSLDFAPPGCELDKNAFNLYLGLEIEKHVDTIDESIDIFLNHINYLCGKDEKCKEYCINYLAHLVQFPGIKPRTSMVFMSEPGVGKNVFFENFANKILGNKYLLQTADQDKIFGKHNIANQKLMIIVDEAEGKYSFLNSEKMKNNIVCPTLITEPKGIDPFPLKDFGRYLIFSNGQTPVKIELNDRRFTVFYCANDVRNNTKYFKKLIKAFNNKSLVRTFYNYLMDIDLDDFDPTNDRPKTEIYEELQNVNIPVFARWLEDKFYHKSGIIKFTGRQFYLEFDNYYTICGYNINHRPSINKFGRAIVKYSGIHKKRTCKGVVYSVDTDELRMCLQEKGYIENIEFIDFD